MIKFDVILQGESESDAVNFALGFCFCDCETSETSDGENNYSRYVETFQGDVEMRYNFAADYYYFVQKE